MKIVVSFALLAVLTSAGGGNTKKRVVDPPVTPKPEELLESLLDYVALTEVYYAWSKEWFPEPLRDLWFKTGGKKAQEQYDKFEEKLLESTLNLWNSLIGKVLKRKRCNIYSSIIPFYDREKKSSPIVAYDGCAVETEVHTSEFKIGRTAFSQFTIDVELDVSLRVSDTVTVPSTWAPVQTIQKLNPIQDGTALTIFIEDNTDIVFHYSINGPLLKPWGVDYNKVMSICLDDIYVDTKSYTSQVLPGLTIYSTSGKVLCEPPAPCESFELIFAPLRDPIFVSINQSLPICSTGFRSSPAF